MQQNGAAAVHQAPTISVQRSHVSSAIQDVRWCSTDTAILLHKTTDSVALFSAIIGDSVQLSEREPLPNPFVLSNSDLGTQCTAKPKFTADTINLQFFFDRTQLLNRV